MESKKKERRYTVSFDPKTTEVIRKLAEKEQTSMAEVLRRALNFYRVKLKAEEEDLDIILESKDKKTRILVME